jgi:hypothetical protein
MLFLVGDRHPSLVAEGVGDLAPAVVHPPDQRVSQFGVMVLRMDPHHEDEIAVTPWRQVPKGDRVAVVLDQPGVEGDVEAGSFPVDDDLVAPVSGLRALGSIDRGGQRLHRVQVFPGRGTYRVSPRRCHLRLF